MLKVPAADAGSTPGAVAFTVVLLALSVFAFVASCFFLLGVQP